jgi:K+-sensing histidine kinase KdpD
VLARAAPQAVGERLLAIVTPHASSQRVVRRAWRSAQRLGAELDILTVLRPGHGPSPAEAEQLEALRRLGSLLGSAVLIEEGDDVATWSPAWRASGPRPTSSWAPRRLAAASAASPNP